MGKFSGVSNGRCDQARRLPPGLRSVVPRPWYWYIIFMPLSGCTGDSHVTPLPPRDQVPPTIQIAFTEFVTQDTIVTVLGTASDNQVVARVRVMVQSGLNGSLLVGWTDLPITPGPSVSFEYAMTVVNFTYLLTFQAQDGAGNIAETWATVTSDWQPPDLMQAVIPAVVPEAAADVLAIGMDWVRGWPTFLPGRVRSVTAELNGEQLSGLDLDEFGGDFALALHDIPAGLNEVVVRMHDWAGNTSTSGVRYVMVGVRAIMVAAGLAHTCVLTDDGQIMCWGNNDFGQLGDGSSISRSWPQPVDGALQFSQVAAGTYYTCGVALSSVTYCWGALEFKERYNAAGATLVPTPVPGTDGLSSLSAGSRHVCGLSQEGAAYCWGDNAAGQLGTGDTVYAQTPMAVSGGLRFAAITAGFSHSCAIALDGTGHCWGYRYTGQTGTGSTELDPLLTPTEVLSDQTFESITAGSEHTCAVAINGDAYCWGYEGQGRLGIGSWGHWALATPQRLEGEWLNLAAGPYNTCGLSTTRKVFCWGAANAGEIATAFRPYGDLGFVPIPVGVLHDITFAQVVTGFERGCGVTSAGATYCWGAEGGQGRIP